MVKILLALTVCYLAGTAAGRGLLPYSIGVPAANFKGDIDAMAATGARMTDPEHVKNAVTSVTLEGFRKAAGSVGAGR
jgi:hypothetical protein